MQRLLHASPSTNPHRHANIGLLVANLLWGLSFPVVKAMVFTQEQLLPGSGNWFITAMTVGPRFLLAAAVLVLLAGRKLIGLTRFELQQGVLIGIANGLGLLLQVDGLQFTSASVSAFLTQFYAVMIPVVVALRMRRAPPAVVWICVALVLGGVAILGRFDFHALSFGRGELSTLAGSVFFMGQIFLLDDPRYAGNRALPVSAVMFATVGVLFAILAMATAPHLADCLVPWTSGSWLTFTGMLTVFCTLGAFMLMIRWQPVITATEAGLIYCFEPVFASLMALYLPGVFSRWVGFDYPNETLTWQLLIGGGLITVANVLLQVKGTGTGREKTGS
jgi:drug/metabolite transporter (DMT)-like permease